MIFKCLCIACVCVCLVCYQRQFSCRTHHGRRQDRHQHGPQRRPSHRQEAADIRDIRRSISQALFKESWDIQHIFPCLSGNLFTDRHTDGFIRKLALHFFLIYFSLHSILNNLSDDTRREVHFPKAFYAHKRLTTQVRMFCVASVGSKRQRQMKA